MKINKIEKLAFEEFEKVGDDGLFPNHTDKDIWIAGFKAGYSYLNNEELNNEEVQLERGGTTGRIGIIGNYVDTGDCKKSPTGKHWYVPSGPFDKPYCKYCYKK